MPAIGEHTATNCEDHSGSQGISNRKCVGPFEVDPLSLSAHKVDMMRSVEEVSVSAPHNINPLVLETSTSMSNAAYADDLNQHPAAVAKDGPDKAMKSLAFDTNHGIAPKEMIITHKSILDFPVEAAVEAANDLARHLAQGVTYRTPRVNAQQLSSAQHDRTRHATKAVQALLGEGFDYSSMYQDLKTLQGERRKLEMRAKTTVHFQTNLKDIQCIVKQDSFGGEHLLRRKAEIADPSFSGSGAKRQRTTRSPIRDDRSKKLNNIWTGNLLEKKEDVTTVLSSLEFAMYDPTHDKDLQKARFNTTRERKNKAVVNHIQGQRQFKADNYFLQPSFYFDVNKKHSAPPVWVERLTQGKRSHNLSRFPIKESMGSLATKNLVQRRSVRPPGSFFKTSNPIQWTAKPITAQNSILPKKKNSKWEKMNYPKIKSQIFKDSTFEIGSSSKAGQNVAITGLKEEAFKPKSRSIFEDELVGIGDGKERGEHENTNGSTIHETHDMMSLVEDVPTKSEALPVSIPKDINKCLLENSAGEIGEQHSEKNTEDTDKREESSLTFDANGMRTLSRSIWDTNLLDKAGMEDCKKGIENEVTQDDLLAMTLRSILNNHSLSSNESRICAEANDAHYRGVNRSDEPKSRRIEDERKQECKGVQTIDHNSCMSSHVAVSSLPLFPAFLMSNGNMFTPPSYYMPCAHANHSWMTIEQDQSCSASDLPRRKQFFPSKTSDRNRKNTLKGIKWSKKIYSRNKESSSSTTTPSSPASIHEVEDMCETGWNQATDTLSAVLPPPQGITNISERIERGLADSLKVLGTKSTSVELSMKPGETLSHDGKEAIESLSKMCEAEVCDLVSKESTELRNADNKIREREQREVQTELHLNSQVEQLSELIELTMVSELPRNTDFGRTFTDEKVEKKRLSLIPYNDHIYPSPQNSERRTLANVGIPSWALVSKPSSLSFMRLPMVPSWSEIKRPMMISSSSDTEVVSTSDTNSLSSIGELHQKALTILRESAFTPFTKNGAQGNSASAGDTSEGEIMTARSRKAENHHEDNVELGEVLTRKPSSIQASHLTQVDHQGSSEGELSLGYVDPGEMV